MSALSDLLDNMNSTRPLSNDQRVELLDQVGGAIAESPELTRGEQRGIRQQLNEAKAFTRNQNLPVDDKREYQEEVLMGPSASFGQAVQVPTDLGEIGEQPTEVQRANMQAIGPYAPWHEKIRQPTQLVSDAIDFALDFPKAIPRLPFNITNLTAMLTDLALSASPDDIAVKAVAEAPEGTKEFMYLSNPLVGMAFAQKAMAETGQSIRPALKATQEWSADIVKRLSKDDPKMAELSDQIMIDGVFSMLVGGVAWRQGAKAIARSGGTSFAAGATGGQVAYAVMEEPIKQAMQNPSEANAILLGTTVLAALGSGVGVEMMLNRAASNPAFRAAAKTVGAEAAAAAEDGMSIEQLKVLMQSENISPEARAAFDTALRELETPDIPTVAATDDFVPTTTAESAGMVTRAGPNDTMPPMEEILAVRVAREAEEAAEKDLVQALQFKAMAIKAENEMLTAGVPQESVDALRTIAKEEAQQLATIERTVLMTHKSEAEAAMREFIATQEPVDLAAVRYRLASEGPEAVTDIERRALDIDDELTAIGLREKKLDSDIAEGMRKASDPGITEVLPPQPTVKYSASAEKMLKEEEFRQGLDFAVMQKEAILQRPITPNERAQLTNDLVTRRGSWYKLDEQRANAPKLGEPPSEAVRNSHLIHADSPIFPSTTIAERYPQAARALSIMTGREIAKDSWISLNDIARAEVAWFRAAGPRMSDEKFTKMLPYAEEMGRLWDEVRTLVKPETPGKLLDALIAMAPRQANASKKMIKALEEQFGSAISDVRTVNVDNIGVSGYYQLSRRKIGLRETNLESFTHELGHHIFYHGLPVEGRTAFLLDLRKQLARPDGWQRSFPRYAEIVDSLADAPAELQSRMTLWLSSPEEAYAQQAIAALGTNYIPNARTAGTLQKAIDKFSRVFGISFDDWKAVPMEFRQKFIKSAVMPKLERLATEQTTSFDDVAWSLHTIPKDKEEALAYADELAEMLGQKAALQVPDDVLMDMHIGELVGDTFAGMDQTVPELAQVAQRVQGYKVADLPSALTVQIVRGLNDAQGFDLAEMKLLYARLRDTLTRMPEADVINRMLSQGSVRVRQTESVLDAYTGLEVDSFQIRQAQMRESVAKEVARLGDPDELQVSARYKIMMEEYGQLKRALQLQKKRNLTPEELGRIRRSVEIKHAPEYKPDAKTELENSNARQAYEALRAESEPLLEAAQKVLVHIGEADNIPTSFLLDMKAADTLSQISSGKQVAGLLGSVAWRAALLGMAAVESDEENGIATPFGKVSFSLDAVASKGGAGMVALALMGGKPLRWTLQKAVQIGDKAVTKLSPQARGKVDAFVRKTQEALGPRGGLSETQNNLVQAFKRDKQAARVEHLELAQILKDALNPQERSILSMLVTNDVYPGWEGAVKAANMKTRALAETVQDMYRRTTNELIEIGISPKKMAEVQNYMNRMYLDRAPLPQGKFTPSKLFERVPQGMKLDFLKQRGQIHKLENPKTSYAFGDSLYPDAPDSSRQLAQQLRQLNAPEEATINSYKVAAAGNPEGTSRVYAIAGTELDRKLAASPHALIDEQKWSVDKLHKNKVILRRDYTHMERQLMGETMDAALKVGKFGEVVSQDIAKLKMYQRIAEFPEHVETGLASTSLGDIPMEGRINELISLGWWKVPAGEIGGTGVKKYGALAGKFVSPEMRDVLKAVDSRGGFMDALHEVAPNVYKAHKLALGAWKMSKTVAQPATHVTNIVGNVIQNWLAGENPIKTMRHGGEMMMARNFDIRYNRAMRSGNAQQMKALAEKLRNSPALHENWNLYKETRSMQLGESSILTSDTSVQALMKETLQLEDALRVGDISSDAAGAAEMAEKFIYKRWANNAVKSAKTVARKAAEVYEMGDLFFKLGVYKTSRLEGGAAEDALGRAYKAHFDYGALPSLPQVLKDTGIMPFASYAYKAAELMADTVAKRPGRLAMAALLMEGLHYRTMAASYGIEDMIQGAEFEQAAITREGTSARRLGLFRTQLATGSRVEEDAWGEARDVTRYANVGYYIPGGDMFETTASVIPKEGTGTALGMVTSGINAVAGTAMGSPLLSILTAAATGNDPFLKRPLGSLDSEYIPGSNDEAQKLKDFGKYFYRTMVPNLPILPGTYSNQRLARGLAHEGLLSDGLAETYGVTGYNSLGMPQDLVTQFQNFAGLRMSSVDADESLANRINRINMAQRDATRAMGKIEKSPAIPDANKDIAADTFEEVFERKQVEIDRLEDLYTAGSSVKAKLQNAIAKREAAKGGRPALGF